MYSGLVIFLSTAIDIYIFQYCYLDDSRKESLWLKIAIMIDTKHIIYIASASLRTAVYDR